MFLNSWRKWLNDRFGNTRGKSASARHKRLRKPLRRPELERLEDRLAPATVTYTTVSGLLQFDGRLDAIADNVTVSAPAANQVVIQVAAGDTITLAGNAVANPDFVLSAGNTIL